MRDREMLRLMTVLCIPLHLQYRYCSLLKLFFVCVSMCVGVLFFVGFFQLLAIPSPKPISSLSSPVLKRSVARCYTRWACQGG